MPLHSMPGLHLLIYSLSAAQHCWLRHGKSCLPVMIAVSKAGARMQVLEPTRGFLEVHAMAAFGECAEIIISVKLAISLVFFFL